MLADLLMRALQSFIHRLAFEINHFVYRLFIPDRDSLGHRHPNSHGV